MPGRTFAPRCQAAGCALIKYTSDFDRVGCITRAHATALAQAWGGFPAVLVTGPRQSGKTAFLRHEAGDERAYVSVVDLLERDFAQQDPDGFVATSGMLEEMSLSKTWSVPVFPVPVFPPFSRSLRIVS